MSVGQRSLVSRPPESDIPTPSAELPRQRASTEEIYTVPIDRSDSPGR
jgi:hypothetical protein